MIDMYTKKSVKYLWPVSSGGWKIRYDALTKQMPLPMHWEKMKINKINPACINELRLYSIVYLPDWLISEICLSESVFLWVKQDGLA